MLLLTAEIFPASITKDDLALFEYDYPNSVYSILLKRNYRIGATSGSPNSVKSASTNIHYVNSTDSSLRSLFKNEMKGKRLYVDLWASWCMPCRQEFKYYPLIDTFFQSHQIEKIFISIDSSSHIEVWKKTIQTYSLDGNHVLAGKKMYDEMEKVIFKGAPFSIPRYLIVDENGEILSSDAERPSAGSRLLSQLKILYKIKM